MSAFKIAVQTILIPLIISKQICSKFTILVDYFAAIMPVGICDLGDEAVNICQLLNDFGCWLASAVTRVVVNSDQQRILSWNTACSVLQGRHILVRVQWYNSIIVIRSRYQHRRVFSWLHSV